MASSGGWNTSSPAEVVTPTSSGPNASSYALWKARNGAGPFSAVILPEANVSPSTHSGWSESCWRTRGSWPDGAVYTGTSHPEVRAARSTLATVAAWAQTSSAVAPDCRAWRTWGATSPAEAGTTISSATASGLKPNATSNAFVPWTP